MKLSSAVVVSLFCFVTAVNAVSEPDLPEHCKGDDIDEEEEEELDCIETGGICTGSPDDCCDGLGCYGYGFFKRCQEPPVCLKQWADCSDGTDCCDDFACIIRDNGAYECDYEKIGTRTVDLNGPPEDPTPAPAPKNPTTTHPEDGSPVGYDYACSSGDPHIRTFDGEKYDCQGEGIFVLAKSWVTGRELQARYEHMSNSKSISIGKGMVVQDEGNVPKVEISIASYDGSVGNYQSDGCTLLGYVDNVQFDLDEGYEDDDVVVKLEGNSYVVTYKKTGLEAKATYFKCRFNICLRLPTTDLTYGVLGTANDDSTDEWMLEDGSVMPIPEDRSDKLKRPGYEFCAGHMCIRDETKSLFANKEPGYDFDYYNKCDLPFGDTFEEFIDDVPQWVIDICGNELSCIMDVRNGDEEDARMLRLARMEYSQTCNPTGGECDDSDCCGDIPCVNFGGAAGKTCGGDMTCSPDMGSCDSMDCCGDLVCVELNDGSKQCRKDFLCQEDWMSCGEGKECCDGLTCLFNAAKGINQCRSLPTCMGNLDDCSLVGCCGDDLKCVDVGNGGKQCQYVPDCWNKQWKDCSVTPCCDGLTCIKHKDGRDVCRKLPSCAKLGKSCEYIPCCDSGKGETECVPVMDKHGKTGKQCRLAPGAVEVQVFDDIDGGGQFNPTTDSVIEGVKLVLVDHKSKEPISGEAVTNGEGVASFDNVPKAQKLRVKVLEGPVGGVATRKTKGNKATDSNLHSSGFSDSFYQTGDVYTSTMLGYVMPRDVEVHVFDDANNNGKQDDGEAGIVGVHLQLALKNRSDLKDSGAGGNAHEELVTNDEGIVVFKGVPQNIDLRVQVTKKPPGATATLKSKGNDIIDSDLNSDMFTDSFKVGAGEGAYTQTDIGFKMPESVVVKVWDDADADGKQENGEPGISGVKLRLTKKDKTPLTDVGNGGNAHEIVETNDDGIATFTQVSRAFEMRVEVVEKPEGSIPTSKGKGNEAIDSDLNSDMFTDSFRIDGDGSYKQRDIGLKMPGSMVVRVWDDENNDGKQSGGELGIAGVTLRVVTKGKQPMADTGGNCHEPLDTDSNGLAVFTGVPAGMEIRVFVENKPPGAIPTSKGKGGEDHDSDLNNDGYSDSFKMSADGEFTKLDLGYKMPDNVQVRVWDDENQDGKQSEGEVGIPGVALKLVKKNKQDMNPSPTGNSYEVTTDESGMATFLGVPKGVDMRVKVEQKPPGAQVTSKGKGGEDKDSDLNSDSFSDSFNLNSFKGGVYGSIDLGYRLPEDVQVFVWDDVDGDGKQDTNEPPISGVSIQLVQKNRSPVTTSIPGSTAGEIVPTNQDGYAVFLKVPKNLEIRAYIPDRPAGAIPTTKGKGGEDQDSDLNSDNYSDSFKISSFTGQVLGQLDLGFRMPKDVKVKVWDDLDGDGKQENGEPGIQGVELRLVKKSNKQPLENPGGGSTAHLPAITDSDGFAVFENVPRGLDMRVFVETFPPGSVQTSKGKGNDSIDSDLNSDRYSDSFSMTGFTGAGAEGKMDLGFRMPKTLLVRVWNDADGDGKQDSNEEGFPNVPVQLLYKNKDPLADQGNGGNAHETLLTDAEGRVRFTKVPQSTDMRVKVVTIPEGFKATGKNKGGNDQLDSEVNSDGVTDSFRLPSNIAEMYDRIDCGFKPI